MKVISFLNMKGGVGKTTSSINTAVGLAGKGSRVLLIDIDPQANATAIFSDSVLSDSAKVYIDELLERPERTREALQVINSNLHLIPSRLKLADIELKIKCSNSLQHNKLAKVLNQVKDDYDYCVIDCPPILNILTVNVLYVSDEVIIPIKPDRWAVEGFTTTYKNAGTINDDFETSCNIRVLFTVVNRNNSEKKMIKEFKDSGVFVFDTTIRNQPKPIASAGIDSLPVITAFPNEPVSQDYLAFINELEKVVN